MTREDQPTGELLIVATPIGNLDDLTVRAAHALCQADLIACEDTRVTGKLLKHLGSTRPMIACHDHNEAQLATQLADRIAAGETIALVSDAGTPLLSDPGFRLVRACRMRGLRVTPLPGPSALLAVLSASGLPCHAFFFAGFPPPKSGGRVRLLEDHREASYSLVLYESCHRVVRLLDDLLEVMGPDRMICLGREVTKLYETFLRGPASAIRPQLQGANLKGEFVLVIAPHDYRDP